MSKKRQFTDTQRLEWLIRHGYTPAIWRNWQPGEPLTKNPMVFVSKGGRREIDAAMENEENKKHPQSPIHLRVTSER